jgi:murein L,D-transpeptidase YcbB/YkuD
MRGAVRKRVARYCACSVDILMARTALLLVSLLVTASCNSPGPEQYVPAMERAASRAPEWSGRGAHAKRLWAIEKTFYEDRGHRPAWIDGDGPTEQLDDLLEALRAAPAHGLDPEEYGYSELSAARARADEAWFGAAFEPEQIPALDLRLTHAFLAYAADLAGWRPSARDVDRVWQVAPKKEDLAEALRGALDANRVREALEAFAPSHPQYKGLQAALVRYREQGGSDADVERIRINMERWRWAPRDLGDRHVLVNVPAYQMQVVEGGAPVLSMRVIVGAPDTPTPLFSDEMAYVVFSPYWNIPESILREETLPRVASDPEYLSRSGIEVVGTSGEVIDAQALDWEDEEAIQGLRFRQAPGPENALGLVKFIFPNHFSVYLHDTPGDALFNRKTRTLSHGCVRVEKPVELAEYVLRGRRDWDRARIVSAMQRKAEQTVHLEEPLPVHIGYWTAWVNEDGTITVFDDPYGLDARQAARRS